MKEIYVLRRAHSSSFIDGVLQTDIIGFCETEDEAKKHLSVFVYYEKVKLYS